MLRGYECADRCYFRDDMRRMGFMFERCSQFAREAFGIEINEIDFLNKFMRSEIRWDMDQGFPKLFGQSSYDTFCLYVEYELYGDYSPLVGKSEFEYFAEYELWWMGQMYVYAHFETGLPMRVLVENFPLDDMRRFYPAGHQLSFRNAFLRIRTAISRKKKYVSVWERCGMRQEHGIWLLPEETGN